MDKKYLTPDSWIEMIRSRILTPYTKPEQVVIDAVTADLFEKLDARARAHATAKGEHEALLYLHIFAIWNSSLWIARYNSWEEYCEEWDKMPFGVSKSSIKHKMTDIKKLLAAGVTTDTIVKALGTIPMATRNLLEEAIESDEDGNYKVSPKFYAKLPEGVDPDKYLDELSELGPIQANLAVDELRERIVIFVSYAEYDKDTQRLLFKLVSRAKTGELETELYIPAVPDWAGRFLEKKLTGR